MTRIVAGTEGAETLFTPIRDRLLLVDDDRVHRMVIARIARQAHYEVDEASTYEDAVRLSGENSYGCVTVDLRLGAHGGLDVLQHLAQIKFDAPVIVVSGSNDNAREEADLVARRLGLDVRSSFGKPVDLARLRHVLTEIRKRQVIGASYLAAFER